MGIVPGRELLSLYVSNEDGANEQAKRGIIPGEELTYDYANASGLAAGAQVPPKDGRDGLTKCLCGSRICRGWMPFDPDV